MREPLRQGGRDALWAQIREAVILEAAGLFAAAWLLSIGYILAPEAGFFGTTHTAAVRGVGLAALAAGVVCVGAGPIAMWRRTRSRLWWAIAATLVAIAAVVTTAIGIRGVS